MTDERKKRNQSALWQVLGKAKGESYFTYKFNPIHRIGLTNALRERKLIEFVDPKPTDTVLDIGCAAGRQLIKLSPHIDRGFGIDVAQSFIEQAGINSEKCGCLNLHFARAEVEQLPFPDGFFDKIIFGEVLEHVTDEHVALEEILRVLKKGGTLAISVPNMNADATVWGRLLRKLTFRSFTPMTDFTEESLEKHGDAHVREFTRSTLASLLQSHGLDINYTTSISFIDGPYGDFLIKVPLRIPLFRRGITGLENLFSNSGYYLGRHLVFKCSKR